MILFQQNNELIHKLSQLKILISLELFLQCDCFVTLINIVNDMLTCELIVLLGPPLFIMIMIIYCLNFFSVIHENLITYANF